MRTLRRAKSSWGAWMRARPFSPRPKLVQAITAAPHVVEQRIEALLDMAEHLVGVVSAPARVGAPARGRRRAPGRPAADADDLLLAGDGHGLAACILDHAVASASASSSKLCARDDLTSLSELMGTSPRIIHDLERRGDVDLAHVALPKTGLESSSRIESSYSPKTPVSSMIVLPPRRAFHLRWRARVSSRACVAIFLRMSVGKPTSNAQSRILPGRNRADAKP